MSKRELLGVCTLTLVASSTIALFIAAVMKDFYPMYPALIHAFEVKAATGGLVSIFMTTIYFMD